MDENRERYAHLLHAQAASTPPDEAGNIGCPLCSHHVEQGAFMDHLQQEHGDHLDAVVSTPHTGALRDRAKTAASTRRKKDGRDAAGSSEAPGTGSAIGINRLSLESEKKKSRHDNSNTARKAARTGESPGEAATPDFPASHSPIQPKGSRRIHPESRSSGSHAHAQQREWLGQPSQQHFSSPAKTSQLQSQASHDPHAMSMPPSSQDVGFPSNQQERASMEMPSNPRWSGLLLQPDSRPISQEQLAAEVKSIYAGLVMVENKCISVDRAQASAAQDDNSQPSKLASDHWQALIALHRTLLHEHHDFFLASQHPSASPALKRLAAKYSMPARMWKHGIHSFLELLRRRLPESLDYMLAFIYLAYQMMALLHETVPEFEDTWIECLGDLGRYRMAIEDEDLRDRETWAGVARFWYSKAADKSPSVGRLYHHLAILARPNALHQLYYYSRSLTCVQPFMSTRESIMTLLDPILGRTHATYSHAVPVDECFIRAHGLLFVQESLEKFEGTVSEYLSQLDSHIGRITAKWKEQGVYVAVTNIASLFGYGTPESALRQLFERELNINSRSGPESDEAQTGSTGLAASNTPPPENMSEDEVSPLPRNLDLTSEPTFNLASRLTFSTFKLVLQRIGDRNILPHVHVLLSFLFSLTRLKYDCTAIMDNVPWEDVAFFLTKLAKSEKFDAAIEQIRFPRYRETDTKPLPEDYLIQGQVWSQLYFPKDWFEVLHDEEEKSLELASTVQSRIERIFWLGVQIASFQRWIRYDRNLKTWSAAPSRSRSAGSQSSSSHNRASSRFSSDDMEVEVHPVSNQSGKSSHIEAIAYDHMDGVVHQYSKPSIDPSHRKPGVSAGPHKYGKNVLLRNYTIFICEKTMLLQQNDVFLMLLDSGDWKVVVPENVIIELASLSKSSGLWEQAAEKALKKIQTAIVEGKNLYVADAQGNYLEHAVTTVERLIEAGMQVDEDSEEIAIGITRRQSDFNAHRAPVTSHPDAKPAILVSEDRATRSRARAAGVASIAASRIRKCLPGVGRKPEGPMSQT